MPDQGSDTLLSILQQAAGVEEKTTWDLVRRWLKAHQDVKERRAAVSTRQVQQNNATTLHLLCQLNNPPLDIVQEIVDAAPDVAGWIDDHGCLPLHCACANGSPIDVLSILIQAYPDGKITQTLLHQETPLHLYLRYVSHTRHSSNVISVTDVAETVELLCENCEAAELADYQGMVPMHCACVYGASFFEVLTILTDAYPNSPTVKDQKGRTPLHLTMLNAHRHTSPDAILFLMQGEGKKTINVRDHDGSLPLHVLAKGLKENCGREHGSDNNNIKEHRERNNVSKCLEVYLRVGKPHPSSDFLPTLQRLPPWLKDTAVINPHVQDVLNQKIVNRFHSFVLMMDGLVLFQLNIALERALYNNIAIRQSQERGEDQLPENATQAEVIFLLVGAGYLVLRELFQIVSLIKLGELRSWFVDGTNYLDAATIFMVLYSSILMIKTDIGVNQRFQVFSAFTKLILWLKSIVCLRSANVQFAVFLGGVYYVVNRLMSFLFAVGIMLSTFALMFHIAYAYRDICVPPQTNGTLCEDGVCTAYFPHCTFWGSLGKVFTMMMGSVGSEWRFYYGYENMDILAQCVYLVYAFVVVILLSNMLIAIVTDFYEVIQRDRAAVVFWSNRLYFVAEMDAIAHAIFKTIRSCLAGGKTAPRAPYIVIESPNKDPQLPPAGNSGREEHKVSSGYFREGWKHLMMLFDLDLYINLTPFRIKFWCCLCFLSLAVFIIPAWFILGLLTAGLLWPPQVREYLFTQKTTVVSRVRSEHSKPSSEAFKAELGREMRSDQEDLLRVFYRQDKFAPAINIAGGWSRKFYISELAVEGEDDEELHEMAAQESRCVNKMIQLLGSRTFPASSRAAATATDQFWLAIRDWLENYPAEVIIATNSSNEYCNTTPLHLACYQQDLTKDVLDVLIKVGGDAPLRWRDENGMLPIHLACAYGANKPVIQTLVEAFSEGNTRTDKLGRTPLHLAVDVKSKDAYSFPCVEAIALVCTPAAAKHADAMGMLPLHHACASVAKDTTLQLLLDAYPEAMYLLDKQERSPLHLLLSNAEHPDAPAALRRLLACDPEVINIFATGNSRLHRHPIDILGRFAAGQAESEYQVDKSSSCDSANAVICLKLLVENSRPTTEFYVAVQSLPIWLRDECVCMKRMQVLMNQKITLRIPAAILLLDFYMQWFVLISLALKSIDAIDLRSDNLKEHATYDSLENGTGVNDELILIVGGSFYLMRETIHLTTVGVRSWAKDPSAWTNLVIAFIVLDMTYYLMTGKTSAQAFRAFACLACGCVLTKIFGSLGHVSRELAVFAGGLPFIAGHLFPFLSALILVVCAFTSAFHTLAQGSELCLNHGNFTYDQELAMVRCGDLYFFPYCERWYAFLQTFAMLLEGSIPEELEESLGVPGRTLSIAYAILVYFVMGNLLIAVVVISYKTLKKRSAILFWTNRLHFLSSFGCDFCGCNKDRFGCISRRSHGSEGTDEQVGDPKEYFHYVETFGQLSWERLMEQFTTDKMSGLDAKVEGRRPHLRFLVGAIIIPLCRYLVATIVIPLWISFGLITFGYLWPPQIRTAVLAKPVSDYPTDRKTQQTGEYVSSLEAENTTLRNELAKRQREDATGTGKERGRTPLKPQYLRKGETLESRPVRRSASY